MRRAMPYSNTPLRVRSKYLSSWSVGAPEERRNAIPVERRSLLSLLLIVGGGAAAAMGFLAVPRWESERSRRSVGHG